ncbi:MAG: MBL fold metallo-hydrolase [bacterium]|nr:MBL fold metallo-hydrolase [bacterium]
MKIVFAGAAREVTGSCYYLETSKARFLVDCGLFQGSRIAEQKNEADFPFVPSKLDFVLLTHAHLDHCGRLPLLYKRGFRGKVYTTEPTVDLVQLILEDAAELITEEADRHNEEPLYSMPDALGIFKLFQPLPYHKPHSILGVEFEFYDAGHILGSAEICLTVDGQTLAFSGDLGNPPVPLLRPTEFITKADYVVVESTYGNRRHEDYHLRKSRLVSAIKKSIAKKGVLLIPAFALERTQEILHEINEVIEAGGLERFPMFLDSPLAIKATAVFRQYPNYYNQDAAAELTKDIDLFTFPGLKMTLTTEQSKAINKTKPPKVIMAGSGMMNGGRILHHLRQYISFPNTSVLIVGFQVEGSIGRQLLDKARTIKIFGEEHQVKAETEAIGAYSSHADQPKLMEWLTQYRVAPKKVFITHGEQSASLNLAEMVSKDLHYPVEVPQLFEEYEL